MIKIIGARGSGKTTRLLKLAEENGYIVVEPNIHMADYVRRMATEMGLNVTVISSHNLWNLPRGIAREKYLVDELEMFLASIGIEGYSDGPLT